MKFKTMLASVLLAGSMQNAWAMEDQQDLQGTAKEMTANLAQKYYDKNQGPLTEGEGLILALGALNATLQEGFNGLTAAVNRQTEKVGQLDSSMKTLIEVQKITAQTMVRVGKGVVLSRVECITEPDFNKINKK